MKFVLPCRREPPNFQNYFALKKPQNVLLLLPPVLQTLAVDGSWRGPSTTPQCCLRPLGPTGECSCASEPPARPVAARWLCLGIHLFLLPGQAVQAWPGGTQKSPRLLAQFPACPWAGGVAGVQLGARCSGTRLLLKTLISLQLWGGTCISQPWVGQITVTDW